MRFDIIMRTLALVVLAAPSSASAQAAAPAPQGQEAPQTDVQGTGTLSSKLSNSGGVIHPQTDVDPGIRKVTPDGEGSAMPVIPPPGTAAGPPGPQPK